MNSFSKRIMEQKYSHTLEDGSKETWEQIAHRVATHVMDAAGFHPHDDITNSIRKRILEKKFIPGGRYLYASGRPLHQVQNCVLLRADDSREGWAEHLHKNAMALMTGAGVGTVYSDIREEGATIARTGGQATGPLALMQMTNECGRGIMQGGSRRSALWAGLHWSHKDAFKFVRMKDWSAEVKAAKAKDYNAPAPMDGTNISVILDTAFFSAYNDPAHEHHSQAHAIYRETVRHMLETAEPGFSVDCAGNEGENLRNACTEITSKDDSDICNLGSINMANIESLEDMRFAVLYGTIFLLAGTLYSDLPYSKIGEVRAKNRRLGLGLMGLHEWLLKRGKTYGPDDELAKYMDAYAESSQVAKQYSAVWGISCPLKTRAIAPTGTIGILANTTTGVEPIFCVAYKRRYLKGSVVNYEYVIDPTANRLIEAGVISPDQVEDAYSISPERRIAFQAWLQKYVDHGISSTINLPAWGSEANNEGKVQEFGDMLMKYLPQLRGITTYPDGARDGQPLSPVKYATAVKHVGQVFIEGMDICDLTKSGSCGS